MTANEYQKAALRTVNNHLNDTELLMNGVMGLCGESGECADIIKKHMFQGHILDIDAFEKELGDVAWYLAITAKSIGCDLDDIFQRNIEKLKARYPEGFNADKSVHRKAGDI